MRKVLFLDFDGVLHGETTPFFSCLGRLERYLMQMPEIEIVISSSWRQTNPFESLKGHFHTSLQERIVGITPSLACGYDQGGRQREIEAFLAAESLNESNARWVALDDMPRFFDEACPFLVLTNTDKGFSDEHGLRLLEWYTNSIQIVSPLSAQLGASSAV